MTVTPRDLVLVVGVQAGWPLHLKVRQESKQVQGKSVDTLVGMPFGSE
jgi:hypothetical protein